MKPNSLLPQVSLFYVQSFCFVLPEFLLRQVELHIFIFLVLFVQPPQCRVRRLVAWLLHKRVDILLKNKTRGRRRIKTLFKTRGPTHNDNLMFVFIDIKHNLFYEESLNYFFKKNGKRPRGGKVKYFQHTLVDKLWYCNTVFK